MNTSMSWIKMYVPDLDVTAQEYTDAMTLSGTKVEGFEKLDADLDKIVIGQIEKIEKHPDADKLIICPAECEVYQIPSGFRKNTSFLRRIHSILRYLLPHSQCGV
jgi:phenylalanyl-tRNA synthetase beta chain